MATRWEVTRYSNGDDSEHRLDLGALEVVVHRHIDNPGKWHVSCHRIGVERRALKATSPLEARGEAILVVRDVLGEYSAAVGKVR